MAPVAGEFMQLSDILEKINPLEKNSPANELYLCLVVSDKKVKSGIWSWSDHKIEIKSYGSIENWEGDNAEELIVVADSSIATAVSKFPDISGNQPTKVVLGLPENWVEKNSIKPDRLSFLEKVCRKLLLKPEGFVVTSEAVSYLIKQNEGEKTSAILVSLEDTEISVSLIVQGKFLGSKIVGRSDSLALDLEEGLLRFDYREALPSRILLTGDDDSETAIQSIVSYPWVDLSSEKKLNFLQFPKVEVLPSTFEIEAVVKASGREIFPSPKRDRIETVMVEEKEEKIPEEKNNDIEKGDFGFIEDDDILKTVKKTDKGEKNEDVISSSQEELEMENEERSNFVAVQPPSSKKPFKQFLSGLKAKFSTFSIPRFSFPIAKFFIFLGILLLLGGIFSGVMALMKTEVKLSIPPQKIEKTFDFTISSKNSSVDLEKMVVPGREFQLEVNGKKTAPVTGKKTVGDKAVGEIVIYNRTEQTKVLPKGSVLKSSSGLKYLLNEEVKVASKSADLGQGIDKWGEAIGKVTAQEIGTQYNIEANSTITGENFSSSQILIKNPQAFAGGTSREIQAVSQTDKENLQKSLGKELETKVVEEAKTKIPDNGQLVENSIKLIGKTDRFNHELGEEVGELTLEEKVQYSFTYFSVEDFSALIDKVVAPLVSSGFQEITFRRNNTFEIKDKNKGIYTAKIYQEYLPPVNTEEIKDNLFFKTRPQADKYLGDLELNANISFSVRPRFLSKIPIFPFLKKNITIVVQAM